MGYEPSAGQIQRRDVICADGHPVVLVIDPRCPLEYMYFNHDGTVTAASWGVWMKHQPNVTAQSWPR